MDIQMETDILSEKIQQRVQNSEVIDLHRTILRLALANLWIIGSLLGVFALVFWTLKAHWAVIAILSVLSFVLILLVFGVLMYLLVKVFILNK